MYHYEITQRGEERKLLADSKNLSFDGKKFKGWPTEIIARANADAALSHSKHPDNYDVKVYPALK